MRPRSHIPGRESKRRQGLFEKKRQERRQTTQQFLRDNQEYWGGIHRELGLLIYDPRDQQHLAAEKVRLYVVAERRRATFMKDLVRTKLVPSRLETWWCPQHAVVMQPWQNVRGTWYSHQGADGIWCTGKAQPTAP